MNKLIFSDENVSLVFETKTDLFSPNFFDPGTLAMLNQINFVKNMKVLDIGCGYGLVGLYAAYHCGSENIWMIDNNPSAVEASQNNAKLNNLNISNIFHSDGMEILLPEQAGSFDLILSNPPYHTDFSVAKRFIEKGFRLLKIHGQMVMVVKRLDWYKNKMISVFGGVKIISDGGYFILLSEKRDTDSLNRSKSKKTSTTKKHQKKMNKGKQKL